MITKQQHLIGTTIGTILLLYALLFPVSGCASTLQSRQTTEVKAGSEQEMAEAGSALTLANGKQKLSYALGMDFGRRLRSQSVEIDEDIFMQGLKDARSGSGTLLDEREAQNTLLELQSELKKKQAAPPADPSGIKVSFKLDPRLTKGMYMGERWVSPPTFTQVGEGRGVTVEAQAEVSDARGRKTKISLEWLPADPDIVTVTPEQGNAVKIIVHRAGESRLKITAAGVAKELRIKATEKNDTIQVDISQ